MRKLKLIGISPKANELSVEDKRDLTKCIGGFVTKSDDEGVIGGQLYNTSDGIPTHEMFLILKEV